jgi:hypothetical protein
MGGKNFDVSSVTLLSAVPNHKILEKDWTIGVFDRLVLKLNVNSKVLMNTIKRDVTALVLNQRMADKGMLVKGVAVGTVKFIEDKPSFDSSERGTTVDKDDVTAAAGKFKSSAPTQHVRSMLFTLLCVSTSLLWTCL